VVGRGAASLVSNRAHVSKAFFPRMLVPPVEGYGCELDYIVAHGLDIVLLVFGIKPGLPVRLPPIWALLLLLATGFAWSPSDYVEYRDVAYVLPWLLQTLLYSAPVAYSLEAVPPHLRLSSTWIH
jgi:lipopolysaccharide transport system permease protein